MSRAEVVQTVNAGPSSSVSGIVLPRKCACGASAGLSGECEGCKKNKLLGKPQQKKLAISEPGDVYEQEADRVTDRVMRMSPSDVNTKQNGAMTLPLVQRRTSNGGVGLSEAPAIVQDVLNSAGQPLDATTRAFFEPRFGHDFSHVRVHTNGEAQQSARAVNAHAYTVGQNIVFGQGRFITGNPFDQSLLAHELAHVAQQGQVNTSPMPVVLRKESAGDVGDSNGRVGSAADSGLEDQPPAEAKKASDDQSETNQASGQPFQNLAPPDDKRVQAKVAQIGDQAVQNLAANLPADGKLGDVAQDGTPKSVEDILTDKLALIDEELAEHQRWGQATKTVGTAESKERAQFVAKAASGGTEGGLKEGLIQGAKMGVGMKVAEKVLEKGIAKGAGMLAVRLGTQVGKFTPVPGVGAAVGGVLAAYDLASRDWKATGEAIGRFGKGASIYDQLANSIEAVSNVLEVSTQILNVIAGVLGAITVVMWVLSVVTAGAMSPIAGTLTAISLAITIGTLALDAINALVLKQLITMFRALHAFTSDADPRDVSSQGKAISQAAGGASGFVGGLAGGLAGGAAVDKGLKFAKGKVSPPVPEYPTPSAASGEGPTVKVELPESATVARDTTTTPTVPVEPRQLVFPGMEVPSQTVPPTSPAVAATSPPPQNTSTGGGLRAITAPLKLTAIRGNGPIPRGLQPGSIGTYGRAVTTPHPFALESNPPGAPGATKGGGRLPDTGREMAGVYLEHQTPAAVAHEVIPGHEYHGPNGQRRGGRDTLEALTISFPESVKPFKDPLDAALLSEVRTRKTRSEAVSPIEVIVRGTENSQLAIAQSGATVPHQQITKLFLAELEQFQSPRFGYTEIRPGETLPAGNPLLDIRAAELDVHFDQLFDPYTAPPGTQLALPGMDHLAPKPSQPQAQQLVLPGMDKPVPNPNQLLLPFGINPTTMSSTQLTSKPPSLSLINLPAVGRAGQQAGQKASNNDEWFAGIRKNIRGAGQMDVHSMSTAERIMFLGGGPIGGSAAINATGGFEQGRQEPVVIPVTPQYPPPPGRPNDIVAMQNEILKTLEARAQTEIIGTVMGKQETHHKNNEQPIQDMQQGTGVAISATKAHQEAVERRKQANETKSDQETKAKGKLDEYTGKAAELVTLTGPMRKFSSLVSIAYTLPDTLPQSIASTIPFSDAAERGLKSGKRELIKMHKDTTKFLDQLDSVDKTINEQKAGHPKREEQTEADTKALDDTKTKASDSNQAFDKAKQTTDALSQQNTDRLGEAKQLHKEANQVSAKLDNQAEQKEIEKQNLVSAMQLWADAHKQARVDAVEHTKTKYTEMGYKIIAVKEK